MQSATEVQLAPHEPSAQRYGAQSTGAWPAMTRVRSSVQVPLLAHFPEATSQRAPTAQSASALHDVSQASAPQAYGLQGFGAAVGHAPVPSHVASGVSLPSLHAAG